MHMAKILHREYDEFSPCMMYKSIPQREISTAFYGGYVKTMPKGLIFIPLHGPLLCAYRHISFFLRWANEPNRIERSGKPPDGHMHNPPIIPFHASTHRVQHDEIISGLIAHNSSREA